MNKVFHHSGCRGDVIYSIPTFMKLGGGKLLLHTDSNRALLGPHGISLKKTDVTHFNEFLSKVTDSITEVVEYQEGMDYNIDMDNFRNREYSQYHANLYIPNLIAKPFKFNIEVDKQYIDLKGLGIHPKQKKIIINRTRRYHNPRFDWEILNHPDVLNEIGFIGFKDEYDEFVSEQGFAPEFIQINNFIEIGQLLNGSEIFIGNQSFIYSIAEMAKIKRVLEVCPYCPNSGPMGHNGFTNILRKQ